MFDGYSNNSYVQNLDTSVRCVYMCGMEAASVKSGHYPVL